jgi:type VI secretion system protein
MGQGLFESLTGHFKDGTPVESLSAHDRLTKSIIDNLNRVFSSRKGSLFHIKDYGLPDISEIYIQTPKSPDLLQKAIKLCIDKYEPRLKRVEVIREKGDINNRRFVFVIRARIDGSGPVSLQTIFTGSAISKINRLDNSGKE